MQEKTLAFYCAFWHKIKSELNMTNNEFISFINISKSFFWKITTPSSIYKKIHSHLTQEDMMKEKIRIHKSNLLIFSLLICAIRTKKAYTNLIPLFEKEYKQLVNNFIKEFCENIEEETLNEK